MSFNTDSKSGVSYLICSCPFLRRTNISIMPDSIGPGRYKATKAETSLNWEGCNFLIKSRMPPLSNWKIPSVLQLESRSYVFLSSSGISLISNWGSWRLRIIFSALSITVKVRRPKKSIFNKPKLEHGSPSNWVVMESRAPRESGTYSDTASLVISTPAAWIPVWRLRPSNLWAISNRRLLWGLVSISFLSSLISKALSKVILGSLGIILAIRLASATGMLMARATSFKASLAFMVPKVIIWETRSCPYLPRT